MNELARKRELLLHLLLLLHLPTLAWPETSRLSLLLLPLLLLQGRPVLWIAKQASTWQQASEQATLCIVLLRGSLSPSQHRLPQNGILIVFSVAMSNLNLLAASSDRLAGSCCVNVV